ncbi:hypothetical protein EUGRSUZ_B01170 [Eucalyptus grandis]|uniref:Uncharacterized protein n=2 Tax=Eucalyptus grandis TaxID=71139 RepID=A0ACC3LPW1_EUCGR|nr:hypothetical protein EUGRSUZ_B01170 [Eucalyptus grandis]
MSSMQSSFNLLRPTWGKCLHLVQDHNLNATKLGKSVSHPGNLSPLNPTTLNFCRFFGGLNPSSSASSLFLVIASSVLSKLPHERIKISRKSFSIKFAAWDSFPASVSLPKFSMKSLPRMLLSLFSSPSPQYFLARVLSLGNIK